MNGLPKNRFSAIPYIWFKWYLIFLLGASRWGFRRIHILSNNCQRVAGRKFGASHPPGRPTAFIFFPDRQGACGGQGAFALAHRAPYADPGKRIPASVLARDRGMMKNVGFNSGVSQVLSENVTLSGFGYPQFPLCYNHAIPSGL